MDGGTLYPLRFEPIFKSNLWGGERLPKLLRRELPAGNKDPIGEAWILTDVGDQPSRVTNGTLAGKDLRELIQNFGDSLLGDSKRPGGRFPLLLKFLEARKPLSVQVHPNDDQASLMTGDADAQGKSEAWVILEAEADSNIYSGLKPGVDARRLRHALADNTASNLLHTFQPAAGDCVFLRSGTVHALGAGLMLFEIQQTSDITYRLYDWGRVDARTGEPRELHVSESLACTEFSRGPVDPVNPVPEVVGDVSRELLVSSEFFTLWRHEGDEPFGVGATGECRVIVNVGGDAIVEHGGTGTEFRFGDVVMLPASVGPCEVVPGGDVCVLECGLPARGAAHSGESLPRRLAS